MRTWLRVLFIGGLTSYRALFSWLSPWILVPTFLFAPLAQILLFAYLGRAAGVADDSFFLIGNALVYTAIPCLFATGNTIAEERQQQTLALILATPARRLPLFLGRALPVIVNGFFVSAFALVAGAALLHVRLPEGSWGPLALTLAAAAFSCTGLGMLGAAVALRVRETAVLTNVFYGVLLLFCGVNIPLHRVPQWMADVAAWLPLTHAIAAARRVVAGAGTGQVLRPLLLEGALGVGYLALGLSLLGVLEVESRRRATLESA